MAWNHGAPLSKKSKGIGLRHNAQGRFEAAGDKPRDSELPTSIPMPSRVEDIRDDGMRAMFARSEMDPARFRQSRLAREHTDFCGDV